jgi:hypothetical protein
MKHEYDKIPAGACTLSVGEFELGDNGENAKSAPIKLVARSGKPIEHWFWGNVVHDLAGMHMHKSRLAIDYVHDDKEIIGYLNKFDISTGDLITSGALVPFKGDDRATEILHKIGEGVPYEASINFGGEGIKLQEIAEGELTEVNGYQFEGPGVVIREWPLRGVAICPYGADMNTESASAFSNTKKVFNASVVEPKPQTEENAMSESVDVSAEVEATEAVEEVVETVETEVVEEVAESTDETSEVEELAADEVVEPEAKTELSKSEFKRIADEFGYEVATKIDTEGGDYNSALVLSVDGLRSENAELRTQIEKLSKVEGGTPAKVTEKTVAKKLFNSTK